MIRISLYTFFVVLAMALLASCGDDNLIKDYQNELAYEVYVVPTNIKISSENLPLYSVRDSVFLEKDYAYRIYAAFTINESWAECADSCYSSILWKIDDDLYGDVSFIRSFDEPGEKTGLLEIVNMYGDTSKTEFTVFVNSPSSVTLEYPANGYNQVERNSDDGVELKWKAEGIDPWETASCTIFASDSPDTLWSFSVGTVDCESSVKLRGFLDSTKASNTVYWAVTMQVSSASGKTYSDTSEIFSFSTKIATDKFASIAIPISYVGLSESDSVNTAVYLISALGDTLQTITSTASSAVLNAVVLPQTSLTIKAVERNKSEYHASAKIIDVLKGTAVMVDTIFLVDDISPQIAPRASSFGTLDSIEFYVLDNGAGLNVSRMHVLVDGDTIEYDYRTPVLSFASDPFTRSSTLIIMGEDYAKNPLPTVQWNVTLGLDSIYVSGPYVCEGN